MCKAHEKKQGFGERGDSERERCAVMCQVMCVWAQRAGTVLRFPILEKECMRGRSLMGTCTRLSLALSGSALCLCSFISLSCHHSYICNMSSQHSRAECVYNCAGMCIHLCRRVYIWMRSPYLTCTDAYVCRMRLINVSECLVCSCSRLRRVLEACSSALELSGTPLKPVSSN